MNKFLGIGVAILVVFAVTSCTTTNSDINYSYPHNGYLNNATLAVKDYQSVGIIFVKSSEALDEAGNYTGSKITYEMLMKEAQKLSADDIINIKIDVNEKTEVVNNNGYNIAKTTYEYTATALAIKYTGAIQGQNPPSLNNTQSLENAMTIVPQKQVSSSTGKTVGIVSAVVGGLLLIVLGISAL